MEMSANNKSTLLPIILTVPRQWHHQCIVICRRRL